MGESTLSTFKCAPCGQPATLACKGCKLEDSISRGLVATTRYCSASCQREDWLQHKAFCKAMRAIRSHQALQLEKSKPHGPESQSAQLQNHGLKHHDSANRELPPYQTHQPLANPSHQAHACASCNHPAPYTCKGCSAAPSATSGLVSATWYCSRSCQTGHWSEHKSACKAAQARRKLYEAGETLQKKYYGYCQSIVMIMLKDGSLNANHMILHEENSVQRTTDALTMLQILQRHSEEERAFLACLVGNATDEMGTTVKEHLKDLPITKIHLVTLSLKILRRRFTRQDWQAAKNKHRILRVFLKNGENYALDIAGVQFGLNSPVVPWEQYEKHVLQVETSEEL